MKISELGEFPLIERLAARLPTYREDVHAAVGDDVAVLGWDDDHYQLATCDIQVEGVHFRRESLTALQLGRRAVAINLSDIAAKGGTPQHLLVSLAVRPDLEVEWVEELYDGLAQETSSYGVDIVGGNLSRTEGPIVVDIFLLGKVARQAVLLRSGAQPGDLVLVTGHLGDAAAGRAVVDGLAPGLGREDSQRLAAAHLTPTPRLRQGQVIARSRLATAMLDLSDGLGSDIGHICEQSAVGVRLWAERLPVSPAARHVARSIAREDWELALGGGEDYELCLTVPPDGEREVAQAVESETGTPVTCVGEILEKAEGRYLVLPAGGKVPLASLGWDHFQVGG